MQKSKLKKGFTLVELAIVIAVIAILIAVLVPTFIALIDKAGESKDSQLVKNLNTSITIDNATGDVVTMKDAIDSAKANGYNVAQITPTSDGYDILWDQETKYFLLAEADGTIVYSTTAYENDNVNKYSDVSRFWKIIDSEENLSSTYSNYIAYSATKIVAITGVDVGENESVEVIIATSSNISTYKSAKTKVGTATAEKTTDGGETESTIMVNCNAGTLVIDTTETVTINGNISANVEIKASTTVVIAAKANVPNFIVSVSGVTITNNSSVKITAATTDDSYNITVNGSSNDVIEGIDSETLALFAGGFGTESSPYQIATAEQFTNITKFSGEMANNTPYCFILTNDITLSSDDYYNSPYYNNSYFCGTFDGDGYEIHLGFRFNNSIFNLFKYVCGETTIKDVDLYSNNTTQFSTVWLMWGADTNGYNNYGSTWSKVTFYGINFYSEDNVTVELNSNNTGFITANTIENYKESGTCEIIIEKCNVYASISNTGTCTAALVNYIYPEVTATIKDCVISGNITGNTYIGVITANPSYNTKYNSGGAEYATADDVSNLTIENVKFTGKATGMYVNAFSASTLGNDWILNKLYQSEIGGTYITTDLSTYTFNVYTGSDGLYVEALTGTNKDSYNYTIALNVSAIYYSNGSVSNGIKFEVDGLSVEDYTSLTKLITNGLYAYEYSAAVTAGVIEQGTELTSLIYAGSFGTAELYLYIDTTNSKVYLISEDTDDYTINSSVSVLVNIYCGNDYVGSINYTNTSN